jgi:hypothetical protein
MNISQENITYIRFAFSKMKSKDDFMALLNYVKPLIYGEKSSSFELKQLTYYSNPNANTNRYYSFEIKKKTGGIRKIHAPVAGLKAIQKCINLILQIIFKPHEAATGFVIDKSIVDNARLHIGSIYVFNIDLKDFFPSIDQARVWRTLQLPPFNLGNKTVYSPVEKIKLSEIANFNTNIERLKINNIVSAIICFEMNVERQNEKGEWILQSKNVLPQGAPTSPIITNIVCQRLDYILTGVAKRFGLKYSRYADDITFSSQHNVFQKNSEFMKELQRVIGDQKFHIKETKTRLQKQGYRQEVTGLIVNKKVNVPLRYIKKLRVWLHRWELLGYQKAEQLFLRDYVSEKGDTIKGNPNMTNVISGKLMYLSMVRGMDDERYKMLKKRYERLIENNDIELNKQNFIDLDSALAMLKNEGLEKARKLFPL